VDNVICIVRTVRCVLYGERGLSSSRPILMLMTQNNKYKITTKLVGVTVTVVLAVSLLSLTALSNLQQAQAANCIATYGQHCTGTSQHKLSVDQLGERARLKYVQPAALASPAGTLWNPLWAIFPTGQILEVGWKDVYPVGSPVCYRALDGSQVGSNFGTPPTTLTLYYLHDDNQDKNWTIIACGFTFSSGTLTASKVRYIQSGYETSNTNPEHNLNTSETKDVQFLSSSFVWTYIDHLSNGNSGVFSVPATGYMWVSYCATLADRERSHYMYGDGTQQTC